MAETYAQRRRRLTAGFASVRNAAAAKTAAARPAAPVAAPAPSYQAPAPAAPSDPLGQNRNAYDSLVAIYTGLGIGELAPVILSLATRGITDGDTVEILLREEPAFKKRFAANEDRKKRGFNVLSVSDYLGMENRYAALLAGSGLPAGFYDSRDDFTNWIANDVSGDEIASRIDLAQRATKSSDPGVRQALAEYYNLGEGDLVAHFLDPKRATTLFDARRQYGSATVGAAASAQGLRVSKDRAQFFQDQGKADQAAQGYENVARVLPRASALGSIYNQDYSQADAEDEFIGGTASARRKRESLAERDTASFSGNGGLGRGSLGRRTKGRY